MYYATVHRVVALAFVENPENKPAINHIDCNKYNNYASNLEWVSFAENSQHAVKNGRFSDMPKGSESGTSKLVESEVINIRERIRNGETQRSLSKEYNVSESLISMIKNRRIWTHI